MSVHKIYLRDFVKSLYGEVERELGSMGPEALAESQAEALFSRFQAKFATPVLAIDEQREGTKAGIRAEAEDETIRVIAAITSDSWVDSLEGIRLIPSNHLLGYDFGDIRFSTRDHEMSLVVRREKSSVQSAGEFLRRYAIDLTKDAAIHYSGWQGRINGMIAAAIANATATLERRRRVDDSLGIPVTRPRKTAIPQVD